ncbi:hypothetical protein P3X46_014522 [Hevea brasiliensis]|uniref:AB hydrolase-1 domain-containing protein n=1 Tax=Hevea brasiliensis TaxID=3981 RepID=A0ABQ9M6W5_HEVBR|nr:uncharacterized protein LOC110657634 isoform X1 [Hevea brasiliensis]KAJ9176029.1 hypothetical protein P3X46_014522 [Hevea brasiliensis]
MKGIVFQQPAFLSHYYNVSDGKISRNNGNTLSFPDWLGGFSLRYPKVSSNRFLPHSRAAAAASSSAAPGSGCDPWLEPKTQQRKKKIAGVDQDELLDPKLLADPDSCFCEFEGVHIHHKVYTAESQMNALSQLPYSTSHKIGLPIILLHGFGASVFSWSRVMKRLAEVTASKVLAFDRPAFGLTSRVDSFMHSSLGTEDTKPLNLYSMAFSVLATLQFIDLLEAEKAILVGHSAGSLVAVESYFEAPERIAALILVAPAIFAPRPFYRVAEGNEGGRDTQTEGDGSNSNGFKKQFIKLSVILLKLTTCIIQAITQMLKGMADMLNSLYKKVLSAILRSDFGVMLIRMLIDKFGTAAVRFAWYDSKQVSEHVLDGYTKPLRAKGWDKALAEFTAATLAYSESGSKPQLSKRLHEISCPVLIVTGDSDRIVPSWNAKRLAQAIPGSCLQVIKHCGHLPHEEKVEEFVSVVEMFLKRAFGDFEEPSLQAVI